jgi:WhiB family redox-sensing transcriptional regulator
MAANTTVIARLHHDITAPMTFLNQGRGACADADPEMFFDKTRQAEAAAVCHGCPIRAGCKAWVDDAKPDGGVWAGTTEQQRQSRSRRVLTTAKRRAKVASLHGDGRSAPEIALRLGCGITAVYSDLAKLRRRDVLQRYPTREERVAAACRGEQDVLLGVDELEEAIGRLDDGRATVDAIAARLHISTRTVQRRRTADVVRRYPTPELRIAAACRGERHTLLNDDELDEALRRVDDGRSTRSIALLLHISTRTVVQRRAVRQSEATNRGRVAA